MDTNMTMTGAVDTTCAFPRVWDKRARLAPGNRRLASVTRAFQGMTLPAAAFSKLGQVAGYRSTVAAPVGISTTHPFITTSLDALPFRTARPPV